MKQSLLPLICIALSAGCGTNPKEKTSASADHMQHRIERNEVTVDTLRRRDFVRELISNGRLIAAVVSCHGDDRRHSCRERRGSESGSGNRQNRYDRIRRPAAQIAIGARQEPAGILRRARRSGLSRRRYDQRSGRGIATGTHPFGLCRCLGVAAKRSQKSRTMLVMRAIFR